MAITTYLSIISLNVHALNTPIKTHRVAEWMRKQNPYTRCLQETQFRLKDTQTGMEKIFYANENKKIAGVAILFFQPFLFIYGLCSIQINSII